MLEAHVRGALRIDAPIAPLPIACDRCAWLRQDAATHSIDLDIVNAAMLEIVFDTSGRLT